MDLAHADRTLEVVVKHSFRSLWRGKFLFLLLGTVLSLGSAYLILSLRPLYEGAALLVGGQASIEFNPNAPRQPADSPAVLVRIAESEEAVRQAALIVGLDRLTPAGPEGRQASVFLRLREQLFGPTAEPRSDTSQETRAGIVIRRSLNVRNEGNASLIRISYRHPDPHLATEVANALARAFIDRHTALYVRPGAAQFFERQGERFEQEFITASEHLKEFSLRTGVSAINEQNELLLRRLNDLDAALAQTRSTIADKLGQRQALADQLRRLAPVARSSYVSSLVDALGGTPGSRAPEPRIADERLSDPPLLLVRVYQDSMVSLFKINGDLSGAQSLQQQQAEERARLTEQINRLSQLAQEFAMLQRARNLAATNQEMTSRRAVEEQINAELTAAQISALRVLQPATEPTRPVFPNYGLMIPGAIIFSFGFAAALVILKSWLFRGLR
jgi:hypothetical protein